MIHPPAIYPVFLPQLGCPHQCFFCNQKLSSGTERPLSPGEVLSAVLPMVKRRPHGEVAFYGGSFTALPDALQEAYLHSVEPLLAEGVVAGIRLSTRPDSFGPDVARFLACRGVRTVEFGVQSFDDRVLEMAGRGHSAEAAIRAVSSAKGAGLQVGVQLMPGLPGADDAEATDSLSTAGGCGADFVRIFPTVVLRETRFASMVADSRFTPWPLCRGVRVGADLLLFARRIGLAVIRLGLQQGDVMGEQGAIVAGPHHPAFGEMVLGEVWRRAFARILTVGGEFRIHIHPADRSRAAGYRKGNLFWFAGRHIVLDIQEDPSLPRDMVRYQESVISVYPGA